MKKTTFFLLLVFLAVAAVSLVSFHRVRSSGRVESYDPVEKKISLLLGKAETFLKEGRADMAESAYVMVITNFPHSGGSEKALRGLAEYNREKGDLNRAEYYYSRLIKDFPDISDISEVKGKIDKIKMEMMKSKLKTADSIEYTIVKGDTLYGIAKKFNTTIDLIKKTNDLKTDVLQIGQKLKISTARFSIRVDKANNILELMKDGEIFKTYTVATGKDNSTPTGVFKVTDKMIEPVWTKPGVGMVMPGDESYELGARWIPISLQGYGIHGTNDEASIGAQVTAGCVRMYNSDVIELYDIIPVGTEVEIIDSAMEKDVPAGEEVKNSGEEDGNST
ncbi:MAG: L,D-transpeptidase family protein [Candidatus Omnitrophota bacterium]